jgi:uncharacterized ferritin-like protein (DUF455 family)
MSGDLYSRTLSCLQASVVDEKLACVEALHESWQRGELDTPAAPAPVETIQDPGRPSRPALVSPFEVGRRSPHTPEGRAALVHALAHIEFNAVNLALDAVYRFRDFPRAYVDDWLKVAAEEAFHFELLREHLRALGHDYGDFPAHNGLWEMAVKSAHDPLARLGLVPKLLEARGLDANPALVAKFRQAGDQRAVEILEIILRDEIGHVAIGNRWFDYLCAQRGLDPLATFRNLLEAHNASRPRKPFNTDARAKAGFSAAELAMLEDLAASHSR